MKVLAAVLSAGTAAVSIFTFARSYGLVGAPAPVALTVGNLGVSWVGLSPATDTATSIGDTIQLAATVTDANGTALIGATIRWSSDNPAVADVIGGGKVVAKGAGTATIMAAVGETLARSRLTVRQRVAAVRINGDSALTLSEDERRAIPVEGIDAHGYVIPSRTASWRSLDTAIVTIDSTGVATGRAQGSAPIAVAIDGITAQLPARVVALPSALEVVAGAGQRARAGAPLAQLVAVRLLSSRGHPIAGEAVRFRTSDGRGGAEPAVVVTDDQGRARTSWTLGDLPGRQRLLATNEHLDSAAVIVAEADPVAANTRVASLRDGLRGRAGDALPDTLGVRVADSLGRALADVPVGWTVDDGGRVTAIEERTDSLGEAHATWTLGPRSGVQRARVRVGSGRSVPAFAITAIASAGAPAAVAVASGNEQTGRVGAALARRVVLRVTDAVGNPVAGARLTVHANGGEPSDTLPVTDSTGSARIAWTMPRAAGAQRLTARADGVARAVEVHATARPAAPANIVFDEPPRKPAAGKALGKSVAVTVTDVYGNPVPGAVVVFKAASGTAAPRKTATDDRGVARTRWTLGTRDGDQTLAASVQGAEARSALTVSVGALEQSAGGGSRRRRPSGE